MNMTQMLKMISETKLYDKGSKIMWTDEHISKKLLEMHINEEHDFASRNGDKIDKIVSFIIEKLNKPQGDVLDIGCGPGLYTTRFAQKGYKVTGIDFSKTSIEYAVRSAEKMSLDIEYRCNNYLELDCIEKADLVIMIYCDFCVLSRTEQDILLRNVYRALKPGGMFVFDAYNEESLSHRETAKTWEVEDGGFWREGPYAVMSTTKHYEDDKAVLSQHIVYDEANGFDVYRFWEHYFSDEDMYALLEKQKFTNIQSWVNPLKSDSASMENGITFYTASK